MQDIKIPEPDEGKEEILRSSGPSDAVKVKFSKFIQLVATHDFEEVMKQHGDEDVAISGDLLTDLANSHEEASRDQGRKLSIILLAGIIIGIVITYLVTRF